MEMALYIFSILRTQLSIVFSWGYNNPVALKNGIKFRVNGFKHQGWVYVLYDEGADLFVIELYDTDLNKSKSIRDVYAEDLVDIIDKEVERTDDYPQRVKETYNLK